MHVNNVMFYCTVDNMAQWHNDSLTETPPVKNLDEFSEKLAFNSPYNRLKAHWRRKLLRMPGDECGGPGYCRG